MTLAASFDIVLARVGHVESKMCRAWVRRNKPYTSRPVLPGHVRIRTKALLGSITYI